MICREIPPAPWLGDECPATPAALSRPACRSSSRCCNQVLWRYSTFHHASARNQHRPQKAPGSCAGCFLYVPSAQENQNGEKEESEKREESERGGEIRGGEYKEKGHICFGQHAAYTNPKTSPLPLHLLPVPFPIFLLLFLFLVFFFCLPFSSAFPLWRASPGPPTSKKVASPSVASSTCWPVRTKSRQTKSM